MPKAKNEELGRKDIGYKNEKIKCLGVIKRRIWAKMFVQHSKEKQDSTLVCKSIMQQCDRMGLRTAINPKEGEHLSESLSVQFHAPETVGKLRPPHFPPNHVRLLP